MEAGKETEMYKLGYRNGYNDAENAQIDPDYWTRLEHTYAGMAMQGIIASNLDLLSHEIIEDAISYAHALVEKLKGKEERK